LALDYPLACSRRLQNKYVILPQSSGPICGIGKIVLRRMFSGASSIFIRDDISYSRLKKVFPSMPFKRALDLAFFINSIDPYNRASDEVRNIAVTVRGWRVGDITELSDQLQTQILDYFVQLLQLNPTSTKVHVVCQGRKDLEFSKLAVDVFRESLEHEVLFHYSLDPCILKKLYSGMDLLVGMRLHSIILAISTGIPCFGVFFREWGNKNPGIMEKFGLSYVFLDENNGQLPKHLPYVDFDRASFAKAVQQRITEGRLQIERCI
jgi:colanic acid/amylovoran biosynthesis protein